MRSLFRLTSRVMVLFFAILSVSSAVWAQLPAGGAPAPGAGGSGGAGQPGFGGMILPFALMFAVVYFLMIRPQQKRMKEQQALLANLKYDDEVITTSGILGKITGITDKVVTLEIADGVRVKMLKSQISQVVKGNIKEIA